MFLSMVNILKYKRIKWFTDNQNAVSIIAKYSIKLELQDIALCIFKNCVQHNIFIDVEWVPRTNNDKADYISPIIDYDHWGVVYEIFVFWVPHEIDWFANDNNHNLPVFYSHYWTVNSMGIDEFTIDWNGINGWFVPPVCLVERVLRYMRQCTAQEQLFCLYGNRQIIDQVYLLQVKGSLVRWSAVLIYQLTRNTILLVKVINQYLEILIYFLGCWLWK